MSMFHLAQLNIAKMKFAIDDPLMAEFVDNLDNINALAEDSPGFVWRLQTDEGDATAIDYFGSDILVNMSVWESIDSLHDYVYRSAHIQIMAKRKQWFEHMEETYSVLWWVEAGHLPTIEEAGERMKDLQSNGPNGKAFTFKQRFEPPESIS